VFPIAKMVSQGGGGSKESVRRGGWCGGVDGGSVQHAMALAMVVPEGTGKMAKWRSCARCH
jgi:hypothetical protein